MVINSTFKNSLVKQLKKKNNFYFWKIYFLFLHIFKRFFLFNIHKTLIIRLTIKQNNIFLSCYTLKKIIQTKSAGNFKIQISKKKLKYNCIFFLRRFFLLFDTKKHQFAPYNSIVLCFAAPKFLRRLILKKILFAFRTKSVLLNLLPKKSFNGCRAKKMRRKKYKKYRIIK